MERVRRILLAVGIGWSLHVWPSGVREVRHLGDTVGGQAFLVLCPEMELVIAVACTGSIWNYRGDPLFQPRW